MNKWAFQLLTAMLVMFSATAAVAVMPGQRINPNVMIILDTGRGMNWVKIPPPLANMDLSSTDRLNAAITACENMNALNPTVQKTSWQTLVESMLGGVRSDYLHCFYEEGSMRPALDRDTIRGLLSDPTVPYGPAEYQRVSDLTSEYWSNNNTEPHFRLVNCFDPRQPGNRGNWNEIYQQCIGETPSPGHEIVTPTGRRYWCEDADYQLLPSGKEMCFNYNPKALERDADGILARYQTLARFGVATFDNLPYPTEKENGPWDSTNWLPSLDDIHRSGWDYADPRSWYITKYEQGNNSPNLRNWNAGIRSDFAQAIGRLVRISDDLDASNQAVAEVLKTVEPLHCSFDGAMIDDVGEYFYRSPETRPAYNNGADFYFNCRPKFVIFITDGIQTDALEFPQEYCDTQGTPPAKPGAASATPTNYSCPFNSTRQESDELFHVVADLANGGGASVQDVEPLYFVVIGLNMADRDPIAGHCDGDPTWDANTLTCIPPAAGCHTMQWVNKPDGSNCIKNNYASPGFSGLRFATSRQYLNALALTGWPTTAPPFVDAPTGTFRQPPWRELDSSGTPIWDWCTTDPNHCGGENGDGFANGAIYANSAQELTAILDNILSGVLLDEIGTRTELVSSDVTAAVTGANFYKDTNAAQQYVFNSGYHATGGKPWSGFLFRQGYKCSQKDASNSGAAISSDNVDFADLLKTSQTPGNRTFFVGQPDLPGVYDNPSATDLVRGYAMIDLENGSIDDCMLGAPSISCAGNHAYKNLVVAHLKGTIGERAERPLGDIYNSTPAILPPPRENIPSPSYHVFKTQTHEDESGATVTNYERQPYLYVGTNDGILHSFNTWAKNQRIEGWGFVPAKLLPRIGDQFPVAWEDTYDTNGIPIGYTVAAASSQKGSYQHEYGVDASPVAADVLLFKQKSISEDKYWRSLVIGGLGRGGIGYYALDVTEKPETEPRLRWQLADDQYGYNRGDSDAEQAFQEMGYGVSRPALSYVYLRDFSPVNQSVKSEYETAVAILPGGYLNTENKGIETSTGVYLVEAIQGRLIRYLKPDRDDDLCDPTDSAKWFSSNLFTGYAGDVRADLAKTAQLIGEPVVPNGIKTGKVNDEAFIGDDRGRIWRINMADPDPQKWCLEVFFDTLLAEHFPYKDCLDSTGNTPGTTQCCLTKNGNVGATCQQSEIETFMTDGDLGIDACAGTACLTPEFPFPRIPMLAPPTIVQDEDRNNVIVIASGQIDGLTTLDHHRVFSLTQVPTITVGAGGTTYTRDQPIINWWLGENLSGFPAGKHMDSSTGLGRVEAQMFPSTGVDPHVMDIPTSNFDYFGLGEKMMGRPYVFNKVAYFTTFTPLDKTGSVLDACDAGGSKIWGVSYNDPTDFPQLDDEGGGGFKVPYYERPDQLLTGLRIVRRPACTGTEGFYVMVQKAQPDSANGAPAGTTDSTSAITAESIEIPQQSRGFTRVGIDSWSIVLGGQ